MGPAGGVGVGIRSAGRPLQSGKLDCGDDAGLWGASTLLCARHFVAPGGGKPGEVGARGREEVKAQKHQKTLP